MYITFSLFFISLAGIMFMIGRKLAPVRNGQVMIEESQEHPLIPDLQKVKHFGYQSIKTLEHLALVAMLRFYVRFSNFLKLKYVELKTKIVNARKSRNGDIVEERDPNKFLKMISEYKQKVRHIKSRITEEEENK